MCVRRKDGEGGCVCVYVCCVNFIGDFPIRGLDLVNKSVFF